MDKFFIIGEAWYGDWAHDVYEAFLCLGYDAELVYTNAVLGLQGGNVRVRGIVFEHAKKIIRAISPVAFEKAKRMRRQGIEDQLVEKAKRCLAARGTPYLFFLWTPPRKELLSRLRAMEGVKLILCQAEEPSQKDWWCETFGYFDHIFCQEKKWIKEFPDAVRAKVTHLLQASTATKYFPLKNVPKEYRSEIAFVGLYREERAATLSSLRDLDLRVYGYGWEGGFASFPWLLEKYGGPVTSEAANMIFNGAAVCVGTLPLNPCISHNISQRTFDIALAGGFQLNAYNPEIVELFEGAAVLFRDGAELRTLVDHYLQNKSERHDIAKKSHEIAVERHTFARRVQTMLIELGVS